MSLFSAIVKAFVKHAGNFASGLVGVPIAGDIVVDAWEYWQQETDERQRKAELESYARQQMDAAVAEAKALVQREAPQLAAAMRAAIVQYLAQVPASIRRSLRRPADHTGLTVPAGLTLRSSHDLLPFLPLKLPRFKPGDKPLPNSDLELLELLGQGGFGEVWKARHLDRPKHPPVALKFCLDAAAARSLERERDLLDHVASAGKHNGIVQLLYPHLQANPPCLEFEYVEGGDLTGVLAELHAKGVSDAEWGAKIILYLAKIVAFAHGQEPAIIHRDLKPANILVRRRDGKLAFKITDFGIGGLWAKESLLKLHTGQTKQSEQKRDTVLGAYTPLYSSPEQMRGDPADPRDDVHALGIIWFQLQTGQLTLMILPSDWRDDLIAAKMPGPLLELLASCIGRKDRRPQDASDLAQRLAAALAIMKVEVPVAIAWAEPVEEADEMPRMPRTPPSKVSRRQREREPSHSKSRGSMLFWIVFVLAGFLLCGGVITSLVLFTKPWQEPQRGGTGNTKNFNYQKGPLGMKFVKVPKGTFWMSKDGKNAQRQETIGEDFELAAYPVTQAQWQTVMSYNNSSFSRQDKRDFSKALLDIPKSKDGFEPPPIGGQGPDYKAKVQNISDEDLKSFPVECVTWNEVQEFLKKLNEQEKGTGWLYRLPSEAQWEYACRGAATSKEECSFHFYLDEPTNDLSSMQANFNGKFPAGQAKQGPCLERPTKVGSYTPNKLGLFDMNGNISQYCSDFFDADPNERALGITGKCVCRGGNWASSGRDCSAATRDTFVLYASRVTGGFRVARVRTGDN